MFAKFNLTILRFIGFFYGLLKKKSVSYSQKGEDLILKSYFDHLNIKEGYYLDIGCFHPTWISNTHRFHKEGWTGTAIDIDEFKLNAMSFIRGKRVNTLLAAINNDDSQNIATVYKFKRVWSDIDTLDKKTAQMYKKEGRGEFYTTKIKSISINRLLSNLPHVNLLNIDIEGIDHLVVKEIDFKKYAPDVILFEDNENWGGDKAIQNLLIQNGYGLLFVTGGSIAYAKLPKEQKNETKK